MKVVFDQNGVYVRREEAPETEETNEVTQEEEGTK